MAVGLSAPGGECIASVLAGAWIAIALEQDKGADFARMVVASNRWAFPRVSLEEARVLLAERGEHCRCVSCRPPPVSKPVQSEQLELF